MDGATGMQINIRAVASRAATLGMINPSEKPMARMSAVVGRSHMSAGDLSATDLETIKGNIKYTITHSGSRMARRDNRVFNCPDDPRNLPKGLYALVYSVHIPVHCPHAEEVANLAAPHFLSNNGTTLRRGRQAATSTMRGGTHQHMLPFGTPSPPWTHWQQMYAYQQQWEHQEMRIQQQMDRPGRTATYFKVEELPDGASSCCTQQMIALNPVGSRESAGSMVIAPIQGGSPLDGASPIPGLPQTVCKLGNVQGAGGRNGNGKRTRESADIGDKSASLATMGSVGPSDGDPLEELKMEVARARGREGQEEKEKGGGKERPRHIHNTIINQPQMRHRAPARVATMRTMRRIRSFIMTR